MDIIQIKTICYIVLLIIGAVLSAISGKPKYSLNITVLINIIGYIIFIFLLYIISNNSFIFTLQGATIGIYSWIVAQNILHDRNY